MLTQMNMVMFFVLLAAAKTAYNNPKMQLVRTPLGACKL